MTDAEIVKGFDEWLRQYSEDPAGFASMASRVLEAARQRQNVGQRLTGEECLAVLRELVAKAKDSK